MASAQPSFIATREALLQTLRLSHVKSGDPTDLAVDEALRNVRAGFLRYLGISGFNALKSYSFVEDPQTETQALRFIANNVEMMWVRRHLMYLMATRMLDASGDILQAWNYEGFLRSMSQEERQGVLDGMDHEIAQQMALLQGQIVIGSEPNANVSVIQPTTPNPLPQESIFPWLGYESS